MNDAAVFKAPQSRHWAGGWRSLAVLGMATVVALGFVAMFALRYFTLDQQVFGPYWPRRGWLLLHIGRGMIALLVGPGQFWLGLKRQRLNLHRQLGVAYMTSVGFSSAAAFYLAAHTDLNLLRQAGFAGRCRCSWPRQFCRVERSSPPSTRPSARR